MGPTTNLEVVTRRACRSHVRRTLTALLAAVVSMCALASVAAADSATLGITDATGKSDPAADLPRVLTVSGTVGSAQQIYVAYRATGGAPCAPSYDTDPGRGLFSGNSANGTYSFKTTYTFPNPGTFMFCIWIAPSSGAAVSPITQTITLRAPTGTITATFNPLIPRPGKSFTVTVTGATEAPKRVYAAVQSAATACAATYDSDTGTGIISGADANGAFSLQATTTVASAGQYIVCLWLADGSEDLAPIAGPQPQPVSVVAPPPPCIVPGLQSGRRLSTVRSRIRAGHCTLGTITSRRSRRVKRGNVVELVPRSGKRLPNGAAVNVILSSGRRA